MFKLKTHPEFINEIDKLIIRHICIYIQPSGRNRLAIYEQILKDINFNVKAQHKGNIFLEMHLPLMY